MPSPPPPPLSWSGEPIMPLQLGRSNSALGRAGIGNPDPRCAKIAKLELQPHSSLWALVEVLVTARAAHTSVGLPVTVVCVFQSLFSVCDMATAWSRTDCSSSHGGRSQLHATGEQSPAHTHVSLVLLSGMTAVCICPVCGKHGPVPDPICCRGVQRSWYDEVIPLSYVWLNHWL